MQQIGPACIERSRNHVRLPIPNDLSKIIHFARDSEFDFESVCRKKEFAQTLVFRLNFYREAQMHSVFEFPAMDILREAAKINRLSTQIGLEDVQVPGIERVPGQQQGVA